uniref:Uncharacterized protein n=1 Tax=Rhizophora mucronata TaxID=61149 RepID=A0A2P2PKF4_RHIMU
MAMKRRLVLLRWWMFVN